MKQLLLSAFMALMVMASLAEAASVQKRSLEDSVVIFEPRVSLEDGGEPCQGVLKTVGEKLVVKTLPECAAAIEKKNGKGSSVLVYRERHNLVGKVMASVAGLTSQGYLELELSQGSLVETENPLGSDQDGIVAHYIYTHSEGENLLSRTVEIVKKSKVKDGVVYELNDRSLPPGSVVSRQGKLLCLSSGSGQCRAVSYNSGGRHEGKLRSRQLKECMLTKIGCDNFVLTRPCTDGNGVGTCMNGDVTCSVQFTKSPNINPPIQAEIVVCGDCGTTYAVTGEESRIAYTKNGTVTLVPPNPNVPPEGCVKAGAAGITATISVVALAAILAIL